MKYFHEMECTPLPPPTKTFLVYNICYVIDETIRTVRYPYLESVHHSYYGIMKIAYHGM